VQQLQELNTLANNQSNNLKTKEKMKKLILFLAMFTMTFAMIAQERTLSTRKVASRDTYNKYTGVAADTLISTNQDTIQIPYFINKSYPMSYVINTTFDAIAGADTTVIINVYGKVFSDDSYTLIQTATSAAVATELLVKTIFVEPILAYAATFAADSTTTGTLTNPHTSATCYRYYMVEYIISGDDSVGTGISIEKVEWKWWFRDY